MFAFLKKKKADSKLSPFQFAFMMFNYVVGFGFISTIGQVVNLGPWGLLVFACTAFIALGVMLVFARLASAYPDTAGSSYGFAKRSHGKTMVFLQGWNQFIQGPIISLSAPLFLELVLSTSFPEQKIVWKILSIVLYVFFIVVSALPLKRSYSFVKWIGFIKWATISLALGLVVYLAASDQRYAENFGSNQTLTVALFSGSMLSFIFAFGGVEGMTALIKDSKVNNFRKNYFYTFGAILGLYLVFYAVILGIKLSDINLDSDDLLGRKFNISLGVTGIVLYTVGSLANKTSSIINSSLVNARNVGPMGEDGFLPKWMGAKDKYGVYRNATYLSAFVSLLLMAVFQIVEVYVPQNNPFISVVNFGTIAFFVQYFLTAITLLKIVFIDKKLKLPIWELIVVLGMMLLVVFVLYTYMIPPVTGNKFSYSRIVQDVAYVVFMGVGFLLWWWVSWRRKNHPEPFKRLAWVSKTFLYPVGLAKKTSRGVVATFARKKPPEPTKVIPEDVVK